MVQILIESEHFYLFFFFQILRTLIECEHELSANYNRGNRLPEMLVGHIVVGKCIPHHQNHHGEKCNKHTFGKHHVRLNFPQR